MAMLRLSKKEDDRVQQSFSRVGFKHAHMPFGIPPWKLKCGQAKICKNYAHIAFLIMQEFSFLDVNSMNEGPKNVNSALTVRLVSFPRGEISAS